MGCGILAATLKELWDDRTSDLGADWEFDFWNSILGGVVGTTISWAIFTAFKSPFLAGLITVICTAILGDAIIDELIQQINERKSVKQWNY